jgi:hypothetical protein
MARDLVNLRRRWTSARVVAAVAAYSRRDDDPRRVAAWIDPFVGGAGPVVPWQDGALALLPFKNDGDAEVLRDLLREEFPRLRLEVSSLTKSELLDASGHGLRLALVNS